MMCPIFLYKFYEDFYNEKTENELLTFELLCDTININS